MFCLPSQLRNLARPLTVGSVSLLKANARLHLPRLGVRIVGNSCMNRHHEEVGNVGGQIAAKRREKRCAR